MCLRRRFYDWKAVHVKFDVIRCVSLFGLEACTSVLKIASSGKLLMHTQLHNVVALFLRHLTSVQVMAFNHAHSSRGTFRGLSRSFLFCLLAFPFGSPVLKPNLDLSLGEIKKGRELFALRSDNVMVLFERIFQMQKLSGCEGGSYSFWSSACYKTCRESENHAVRARL